MASESKSLIGTLMLPVVDLMMIVTIGFLATGGYIGFIASSEESSAAAQSLSAAEKQVDTQQIRHTELLEERSRILEKLKSLNEGSGSVVDSEEAARQIEQLTEEIRLLKAEFEELFPDLSALAEEVRELKEQADAYGRSTVARDEREKENEALEAEVKSLEEEKSRLERHLASLEARKAREENLKPPVSLGVSMARPRKNIEQELVVVLSKGKVYLLTKEYYTVTPGPGYATWHAKKDGHTAPEALAASSPLMKKIQSAKFKHKGRVVVLVNNDSFATFRLLRDKLYELGIDYAWEPWDQGTKVLSSSSGTAPPSQGRSSR